MFLVQPHSFVLVPLTQSCGPPFFDAWQLHNLYEHMQNNIYVNMINQYQIKNNLPFRKSLKPQEMDELHKRRYPEIVPQCVTSTQVVKQMPW